MHETTVTQSLELTVSETTWKLIILPLLTRDTNRYLHTAGGRAEFSSDIRLYSNLKKPCGKGSLTYLTTGDYTVPLVSLLTWKHLVSTVSAKTLAFASWPIPLQTSSHIASSPHFLLGVYHQKHEMSRSQDSGSKTFATLTDHPRLVDCSLLPHSYSISLFSSLFIQKIKNLHSNWRSQGRVEITLTASASMQLSSQMHIGDIMLDLLSHLTDLWHGLPKCPVHSPLLSR